MLTDDELKAIKARAEGSKARAEAATSGPWKMRFEAGNRWWIEPRIFAYGSSLSLGGWTNRENAAFISAARRDVPTLADDINILLDTVDDLRRQLAEAQARAEKAEAELSVMTARVERVRVAFVQLGRYEEIRRA